MCKLWHSGAKEKVFFAIATPTSRKGEPFFMGAFFRQFFSCKERCCYLPSKGSVQKSATCTFACKTYLISGINAHSISCAQVKTLVDYSISEFISIDPRLIFSWKSSKQKEMAFLASLKLDERRGEFLVSGPPKSSWLPCEHFIFEPKKFCGVASSLLGLELTCLLGLMEV